MKILVLIWYMIIFFLGINAVFAQQYSVHKPQEFGYNKFENVDEKLLFILDFSGSMAEELGGQTKLEMMLDTMGKILPTINKRTWVGLRVYGHRNGFTTMDACRASSLLVPITPASVNQVQTQLFKAKSKGMTPITYSLKRAVEDDFAGFNGQKHIILLTDGGENCDESPCLWAMELVKFRDDVKIDVIAFNISNQDDLDQLECTALVTTGKFHTANTAAELFNGMKKSLDLRKNVEAKILQNP